jgi:hypothetical protein
LFYAKSVNRYGEEKTGGLFLHVGLALAHGPIEDIFDIQLNDEPADSSRFAGLVAFVPFMGNLDQTTFRGPVSLGHTTSQPDDDVIAELPREWLEDHARPLKQIAYLWATLRHNPNVFSGGAPSIRATVKGRLVYDPREDSTNGGTGGQRRDDPSTWRWSNNWALCVRDFIHSSEYGMSIPNDLIDDASVIAAADTSDELIDAPSDRESEDDPMPKIPRYTIDGIFETSETPIDTLARLLQAGNGALLNYGGKFRLYAGMPVAPALDTTTGQPIVLTPDDLRNDEDVQITRMPGRKERVNVVRGTYINPAKNYIPDQFPEATNKELIAQDGNMELPLQLQLDFTQHPDRASYIAAVVLKRERLMRWSWPMNASGAQLIPLTQIAVTHPHFGWTNKPAFIRDRVRLPSGAVNLLLEEYADSTWDQEINPAAFPRPTTLPNPFQVDPPIDVAASETMQRNPDGTLVSVVVLTWNPPTQGLVEGYIIRWRGLTGTTQSRRIVAPADRFEIRSLAVGVYVVSISATVGSAESVPVVVQVSVTYLTAPPPDPIDVRVVQATNGTRLLTWGVHGKVIPPDLLGWEIRWASGSVSASLANWESAKHIGIASGLSFETEQPVAPGQYTYLIRSFDTSGAYSNGVGSVVVTLVPESSEVIFDAEYWELEWPILGTDGSPSGMIVNAVLNEEGHLEGQGDGGTWDAAGTWDDPGSWNSGGGTLQYVTPIVDFGVDRTVMMQYRIGARGHGEVSIQARFKRMNDVWGTFGPGASGVGRYAQFRVTVGAGTDTPTLERFAVRARERRDLEYQNDIDMLSSPLQIDRIEQTVGQWQGGAWQVNCQVVQPSDGAAYIQCDPEPSVVLDGSTYVNGVDHAALRLQNGTFTLEATVAILALASGVVVGKGTDWRIVYTTGVGFQLMIGNSIISGSTLPVTDVRPMYHVAYSYAGGELKGFLNGQERCRVYQVISIPQSSAIVRVGANHTGGEFLVAAVEDVRVWALSRSAVEIARDAGVSVDRNSPGLILWWQCANGSGSVVTDLAVFGLHGNIVGTSTWARVAYRESPSIPLSLLPSWRTGRVSYAGDLGVGGSILVEYSVDNGSTWTVVTTTPTAIVGLTPGPLTPGLSFRCRQQLQSTVVANSPALRQVSVSLSFDRSPGDIVVVPHVPLIRMDQATVAAVQDATGRVPTWALVAKDATAARFRISDRYGDPFDTVVDVQFAGARAA